jgi:hypothetical protein
MARFAFLVEPTLNYGRTGDKIGIVMIGMFVRDEHQIAGYVGILVADLPAVGIDHHLKIPIGFERNHGLSPPAHGHGFARIGPGVGW